MPLKYRRDGLYLLYGNYGISPLSRVDSLYQKGRCLVCRRPQGKRTDKPLICGAQSTDMPHILSLRAVRDSRTVIVSEAMVDVLGLHDRFSCREVQWSEGRIFSRYFEINPVDAQTRIPYVAVREMADSIVAIKCSGCGAEDVSHEVEQANYQNFVDDRMLNAQGGEAFILGDMLRGLAVTGTGFERLSSNGFFGGKSKLGYRQIGIASQADMVCDINFTLRR